MYVVGFTKHKLWEGFETKQLCHKPLNQIEPMTYSNYCKTPSGHNERRNHQNIT